MNLFTFHVLCLWCGTGGCWVDVPIQATPDGYGQQKITHRNCGASMRRFIVPGDMPRSWERDRTMTRPGPKQAGG